MELSDKVDAPPAALGPVLERDHILSALRARIVAFAASRISRDLAEDLAQEVLLVLHEKYPHVQRLEELLPLCLRIMRFKIMAQNRKSARRGERTACSVDDLPLRDPAPGPEEETERRELAIRVAAAVRRLGPRCKELLRLKLEGLSFAEIQDRMGAASINTVYTWDHRCRQHLLALLGGKPDWE